MALYLIIPDYLPGNIKAAEARAFAAFCVYLIL